MRSGIWALLTLCILSTTGYGQIGIQLGWNTTGYKYTLSGTTEERGLNFGLNAGLVYRSKGKKLCVQPELLYTQKGATNNNDGANYVSNVLEFKNKLDYMEFALPIIFKIPIFDAGSFDLGAGPYVSKLLSADCKIKDLNGGSRTTPFKIGTDSTDDFKPIDAGIVFYSAIKVRHFYMSLCYEKGLSDIAPANNLVIKNGCFNFNLGILF